MKNHKFVVLLVALLVAGWVTGAAIMLEHRLHTALPYHDSFAKHGAGEWVPLGGYWSVSEDEVINHSDEPGAMLVTGSPLWTDYEVDADLELRAHGGDVGLALRVNNPQIGINAYRGYYVGIRTVDSALVIGRAENDWLEGQPVPMSGGVEFGVWYHVKAVVVGCSVAMMATDLNNNQVAYAAFRDTQRNCIPAGKIGLRSTDTSGAWKDVRVRAASNADLDAILHHVSFVGSPIYPIREADYSRMRMESFPDYPHLRREAPVNTTAATSVLPLVPVSSVQAMHESGQQVRIQGLVTFTDPVYMQDATGGVLLEVPNAGGVNIGDEVEVAGRTVVNGIDSVFAATGIDLLREGGAALPVSLTATEAASGSHAGTLVEVTGVVQKQIHQADGRIFLELSDSAQNFAALLQGELFNQASTEWSSGSTIRVRGVCVMNPETTSGRSFSLLVASASDVTMIAGPPWWSAVRLARTIALILLAATAGLYMLLRFEKSKNRAVIQEREHLAHEMHDTLAQSFAGVGYYLQSIRRSLRELPQIPNDVLSELDVACGMVTETHREASASIAALHPGASASGDLLTILEQSTYSMLGGGQIPIVLLRDGNPHPISATVTDVLFQAGREAISNALRHSGAMELRLSLSFQHGFIRLSVEDNGAGFNAEGETEGFGLHAMRRRCKTVRANLVIESSPGHGCKVTIQAPTRETASLSKWLRTLVHLG